MFPAVLRPDEVRTGDTVRILTRHGDVEETATMVVDSRDPTTMRFISPVGQVVDYYGTSVIYLVNRPETSPEVEAIVTALGVTYDVASDYHSKGVRIHV
jgi:hypothetical protein